MRPDALTVDFVNAISDLYGLLLLARRHDRDQTAFTATQRLALVEIGNLGPMRLHALAARMQTTPATASRAVDALVEEGLVERVPDERDRRAVQIALTRRGRTRVAERRAAVARLLDPAFLRLSPDERRRLLFLLGELNQELRNVTGHDTASGAFVASA